MTSYLIAGAALATIGTLIATALVRGGKYPEENEESNEIMADNLDRAAEITQQNLDAVLANRTQLNGHAANDECIDCGYEIPTARRQAAPWATTCIECQGIRELKNKQGR